MSIKILNGIIVVGLTLLTFASCQVIPDKSLTGFFDEVSEDIGVQKVEKFKNSEIDSAGHTINFFYDDMQAAYKKLGSNYDLGIYSDSIGREWKDSTRITYLTVAYHLYSNYKEINIESIQAEVKKMSDYKWLQSILESAKEDDELANINNSKFHAGDTISACLLIDNDMSVEYHHYYCGGILSDEEYFSDRHSTNLSGVLLSKSQGERNPTGRDLIFNIKVLAIGREDVIMSYKNITNVGDTVQLDVTSYRRLIERGMSANCSSP
jgi:hypothetical protein